MTITFKPLNESHFSLLLKWLESPHVKKWWDQGVAYTIELVLEKYSSYVKGYKLEGGAQKPIQAFIIYSDQNPVGYIQIYNAYDFPRSKPLLGLPSNLGAFDIFIGEEEVLKQGLGLKAILEFLKLHGNQYSYIFADPDINNLSAIKCYEKAGFKKVSEQADTGEVWMLKDLTTRNDPLPTIQKLIKERYPDAKAAFWAGSVSVNQGTSASDLDLVIVFKSLPHAYREAFIYDGWPIDAFIHDLDTLRYFCGRLEASDGKPALINMILQGQEILVQNSVSIEAKSIAADALANGPDAWNQAQIDKERFLLTDIMDDIKSPKNKEEQIISAVHLFEPLLQFYFRAARKWTASGKSLICLLKQKNPELAEEWTAAFESLVKTGDSTAVETAVTKILEPYGGYLWDGFRADAPEEWRLSVEDNIHGDVKSDELEKIHALEIALLEPQVRKDIKKLDSLIADNFYEIGASGKVYDKNNILARLPLEQNYEIYGKVINFEITHISENLIRANYTLEEKTKRTRRTSIWQRHHNNYQMIFHQGTVIDGGGA